ncbi:DgyrCDS2684 [Dimorphilus gyrociliatus]|uniref:Endoplasmic reticulum transmembrane protein n=1 Tax=Dimorphilus gyrociliatus TaxID=2664684 RepID=A0A7I8VCU3_9ANNE|nr:DgyrCDS2684 [Dimorphilus gyrociliatus]
MSFQWTVVATFLYVEIATVILLMIPGISSAAWQKLFRSRLFKFVKNYVNLYFYVFVALLALLFADGVRDVRKYRGEEDVKARPDAEIHQHMKLFRAQRNLYIAGFALFLCLVIRRIVSLISNQANLEAKCSAALKQAESASATAKQFMKTAEKGAHKNAIDETMLEELDDVKKELAKKNEELRKIKVDFDALKSQAENANIEYDRVLSELQNSQVSQEGTISCC